MTRWDRRELLLGAGCAVTAGAAFGLQPRKDYDVLGRATLAELIPAYIGDRHGGDDAGVVPEQVGAAPQYDQTLARTYSGSGAPDVTLVVAYHGPRSRLLKVHRPETCYRVAGFTLSSMAPITLRLGSLTVPAMRFLGVRGLRMESVVYWTRVADAFPQTLTSQRLGTLRDALQGLRADGLLVRLSTPAGASGADLSILKSFAQQLISSLSPPGQALLLGRSERR